jgi:hypothetical protein
MTLGCPVCVPQVRADHLGAISVLQFGGHYDIDDVPSSIPDVRFDVIELAPATEPKSFCNVLTHADILSDRSKIREAIAPAFGIQRTEHVLQLMQNASFVTTTDVGVRLVALASLMRANAHIVVSGSTGTGTSPWLFIGSMQSACTTGCLREGGSLVGAAFLVLLPPPPCPSSSMGQGRPKAWSCFLYY